MYGYPEGRTHPRALALTELMLDFAFKRLSMQPGPRFFCGDWNFTHDRLQITSTLKAAGWVEVQDHFAALTGAPVQMTCKHATRKDFLWISPEMALGFVDLAIHPHVFADHSVLVARFVGGKAHLERFVWPCPKPVAWTSVPALPDVVDFCAPLDPTAQYAELWHQKELQAQQHIGVDWHCSMQGRGQQVEPKRQVGIQAPIKQGRSHEVQPNFFGFSALHAKRFKQLRRLQNFCRWVDNRTVHSGDALHGICLWNAILRASGFPPNFTAWWPNRVSVSPADPPCIPQFCPTSAVAHQIYEAVLLDVRTLEHRLVQSKKAHRTAQHETDRYLVFREVARAPAEPVETLIHKIEARVLRTDADECAVELDRPVTLLPDQPLWISGQQYDVIHADHDKVWLEDIADVPSDAVAVQTQQVGDLKAIFDAFHDQWQQRWCRHDGLAFSHWDTSIAFAKRVIRPMPVDHLVVDGPLLQAEAARKKRHAATGLDGVSRADLLQADATLLKSLAGLYARAEDDGSWPSQLVAGKVHSLAKTEAASTVGQYRPITIFGLPYRIWSSIQSRHLLEFAEMWVDDSVFGNRRGRQAADLWHHLLLQIETAYAESSSLSGISADLEKCFNCIPRFPALCLAVLVGVPHGVTTAWAGALAQMRRHFKVRESYSCGFLTSTGLAEGCGLSVFGMLLVDHLFACWMRFQAPAVQCLTYVDDWQVLSVDPSYAVRQLELVEQFASMVDLTVDRAKTFCWSTCVDTRKVMRDHGLTVLHHARELGGHMGISRQYTNCTLTQRMTALNDFWPKLASSKAQFAAKVYMLRAVAWPRGLHAVASAPVGDQLWLELRRKANRAIGMQRPGVNPAIVLGLVEALVDPQLVATLWTFRATRVQCPLDFWATSVAPIAYGDVDLPPNSPAMILLQRAQTLGLSVTRQGWISDCFGSFCPQSCNITELELRLQRAWTSFVAAKVSHRADFQGLADVDLASTRRVLRSMSFDDQALYRFGLAGGLYTESYKAKWTDQPDSCPWCGAQDTLRHRFWECPQHADLRQALAPDVAPVLDFLPPALALRGWWLLPPTWHQWTCLLAALPSDLPLPAVPLTVWNDVFTDGSCHSQSQPLSRFAAWSVTVAPTFSAAWQPGGAAVMAASVLAGLCQTAFRAEIFAVGYALHWAALFRAPLRIWTDCLGVVTKLRLLVWGQRKVKVNQSNADLWLWIQQSVATLGRDLVEIIKVPAHRTIQSARSRHDIWTIVHNDFADRAARLANQARPAIFWQVWEAHVAAIAATEKICRQVMDLHLAVGRRQAHNSVNPTGEHVVVPIRQTRDFPVQFNQGQWRGTLPPQFAQQFGPGVAKKVTTWFFERLALNKEVIRFGYHLRSCT